MNKLMQGAGLGLRRELMQVFAQTNFPDLGFMEVAPENWMHIGGHLGKRFRHFTERYPFVCHGLSLSIGSPSELDESFVHAIGTFMREHQIALYSEHLSYCSDHGHLYDLMPIPFTDEAVVYVAARIRRVQEILGQKIAMENVSYYAAPGAQMTELEFLNAVLDESDCLLLLDVNNVYVNSVNHGYDAKAFIEGIPSSRIAYLHVAGHYEESSDLLIDTHGSSVKDNVWDLLNFTYRRFGVFPTLLERDFNIPSPDELQKELNIIRQFQESAHVSQTGLTTIA